MFHADPYIPSVAVLVPASLRFMNRWTECLHGDGLLREALQSISDLAFSEVVCLHRVNPISGAQRSVAMFDRGASQGARPLTRAFGLSLASQTLSRAKPGTLWSMQDLDRDELARLESQVVGWMETRGFRNAMLIILSSGEEYIDVLEFHQFAPVDRRRKEILETLAVSAAEAWGRRPKGRIARILRAAPAIKEHYSSARSGSHPLSDSNPLGLTAAELRICALIQRGTDLTDARSILGIADSTLRSHLRSIFAKAGVTGQVGLVRLLLNPLNERKEMRA